MEKSFSINGKEVKIHDYKLDGDLVSFVLNGEQYSYSLVSKSHEAMVLEGKSRFQAFVASPNREGEAMIIANGKEAVISSGNKKMKKAGAHAGGLTSPMPGKIFKVILDKGSEVKKGDVILILEAMKMEHAIRADKDGTVKRINFKVGELVQGGVTLAELE
jgi:biotin carboxyl carrier protein